MEETLNGFWNTRNTETGEEKKLIIKDFSKNPWIFSKQLKKLFKENGMGSTKKELMKWECFESDIK